MLVIFLVYVTFSYDKYPTYGLMLMNVIVLILQLPTSILLNSGHSVLGPSSFYSSGVLGMLSKHLSFLFSIKVLHFLTSCNNFSFASSCLSYLVWFFFIYVLVRCFSSFI